MPRQPSLQQVVAATSVAALVGLTASACGSEETDLVGLWSGTCSDSATQTFTGRPFSIEFNDDESYVQQATGASTATHGRVTVAEGEQIILIAQDGQVMTGGYILAGTELQLDGLVDPNSRNATPHWCTLTRIHS